MPTRFMSVKVEVALSGGTEGRSDAYNAITEAKENRAMNR